MPKLELRTSESADVEFSYVDWESFHDDLRDRQMVKLAINSADFPNWLKHVNMEKFSVLEEIVAGDWMKWRHHTFLVGLFLMWDGRKNASVDELIVNVSAAFAQVVGGAEMVAKTLGDCKPELLGVYDDNEGFVVEQNTWQRLNQTKELTSVMPVPVVDPLSVKDDERYFKKTSQKMAVNGTLEIEETATPNNNEEKCVLYIRRIDGRRDVKVGEAFPCGEGAWCVLVDHMYSCQCSDEHEVQLLDGHYFIKLNSSYSSPEIANNWERVPVVCEYVAQDQLFCRVGSVVLHDSRIKLIHTIHRHLAHRLTCNCRKAAEQLTEIELFASEGCII